MVLFLSKNKVLEKLCEYTGWFVPVTYSNSRYLKVDSNPAYVSLATTKISQQLSVAYRFISQRERERERERE